jgi:hypothetical protein
MTDDEKDDLAYKLITRIKNLKMEYIDTAIDKAMDIVNEEFGTEY